VAGHVGNLDQVRAALHRGGHDAGLCPAKAAASSPILAAALLTVVATLGAVRR
jgi:hypothetical protein